MKKIINIILILVISVTFCFGCSKKSTDSLVIWWAPGNKYQASLEKALNRYKQDNHGFAYKIVSQPSTDYHSKLSNVLSSPNAYKNAPDICRIQSTAVYNLAYGDRLAEFNEGDFQSEQYLSSAWNTTKYNKRIVSLPLDANTTALMYNKEIFKEAGVTEVPKTYDEMLNACALIKEKTGYLPFDLPALSEGSGFTTFTFNGWMARNGAKVFSEDITKVEIESPETLDVLNKYLQLTNQGYIDKNQWNEAQFYNGEVGMIEMGSWNLNRINSEPEKYGVTIPIKLNEDKKPYTTLGLYSLVVPLEAPHKDLALKVSKFLSTDIQFQVEFAIAAGTLPSLNQALEDEYFNSDLMKIYKEQLYNTVSLPNTEAWIYAANAIQSMVEGTLLKTATPQQLLSLCKLQIERDLKLL